MTTLQAFKALVCFLEDYYNKILSDDIGSLLGDMQLLEDDKSTWDPAAWNDWLIAVENKESMTMVEGFRGVFNFLSAYYKRTSSSSGDIKTLLDVMQVDDSELTNSVMWNIWIDCVEKNIS